MQCLSKSQDNSGPFDEPNTVTNSLVFGYNQPPIIRVEPDPHVSLLTENLTSRQRNLSTQFQNLICYQMFIFGC